MDIFVNLGKYAQNVKEIGDGCFRVEKLLEFIEMNIHVKCVVTSGVHYKMVGAVFLAHQNRPPKWRIFKYRKWKEKIRRMERRPLRYL